MYKWKSDYSHLCVFYHHLAGASQFASMWSFSFQDLYCTWFTYRDLCHYDGMLTDSNISLFIQLQHLCDILRIRWESTRSRTKQRALLMMDKLVSPRDFKGIILPVLDLFYRGENKMEHHKWISICKLMKANSFWTHRVGPMVNSSWWKQIDFEFHSMLSSYSIWVLLFAARIFLIVL